MKPEIVEDSGLTITETLCEALWQVSLWPGIALGDLPTAPGVIEDGIARTGPRTWTVFEANSLPTVAIDEGTVTDLAHSRKRFRIAGERAPDVMRRLAPLDFRDSAFPDGAIKTTLSHHVSVWIARDGDAWDVYVGHTFADAFRDGLVEMAGQWQPV